MKKNFLVGIAFGLFYGTVLLYGQTFPYSYGTEESDIMLSRGALYADWLPVFRMQVSYGLTNGVTTDAGILYVEHQTSVFRMRMRYGFPLDKNFYAGMGLYYWTPFEFAKSEASVLFERGWTAGLEPGITWHGAKAQFSAKVTFPLLRSYSSYTRYQVHFLYRLRPHTSWITGLRYVDKYPSWKYFGKIYAQMSFRTRIKRKIFLQFGLIATGFYKKINPSRSDVKITCFLPMISVQIPLYRICKKSGD